METPEPSRWRLRTRSWQRAAYVLLVVGVLIFVVVRREELARIWREQALTFLGVVGLMMLASALQARNFVAFIDVRHGLRTGAFIRVWAASVLANYLGPLQPGAALRIGYLKSHGLTLADGILATWRMLAASVWVAALSLGVGLVAWRPSATWSVALMLWLGAIAALLGRRALLHFMAHIERPTWFLRHRELIRRAASGLSARGITGVLLQYALSSLLLAWVYARFGAPLSLAQALIMTCAVYVSSLLALLPGNFGVLEAIYLAGGQAAGLDVIQAAALTGLLRVAHIVANAVLALGAVPRHTGNTYTGTR